MLVVDASAVAELLLGRPAGESVAHRLRQHAFDRLEISAGGRTATGPAVREAAR